MIATELLWTGAAAGLAIAMPLGPVGMFCFDVGLRRGPAFGVAAGIGAALGDGLFAAAALVGTSGWVGVSGGWLRLVGGLVLVCVAGTRWLHRPAVTTEPPPVRRARRAFVAALGLTLGNPATLLPFAAVFGTLGFPEGDTSGAVLVVLGVLLGAMTWWTSVAVIARCLRPRLGPKTLSRIDRVITGVLFVFAVGLLISGSYDVLSVLDEAGRPRL
ncbi:MAG: LysE family transporter [Myxococcota bacterium]